MGSNLFNFKLSGDKKTGPAANAGGIGANTNLFMTNAIFNEFRDVIYKQSGIFYADSKKYLLEGRISKRITVNNLKSYEEYLNLIKNSFNKEELKNLFDAITINETYFFRAEQQFDAFENIVAKEIIDNKATKSPKTFRIWSAASSTGEEIYTLAMIIREKLKPKYPQVQFQLVASDISQSVLQSARKGVYKEYAIRNVPKEYLNKYFEKNGSHYMLSSEIKNMVRFVNLNLFNQMEIRSMSNCDIIFCANVLIYFDIPSKQQVVSSLFDALNPGGYLFIGYSESLHGISKAFKLIHLPKAMAYKKE